MDLPMGIRYFTALFSLASYFQIQKSCYKIAPLHRERNTNKQINKQTHFLIYVNTSKDIILVRIKLKLLKRRFTSR